MGSRKSVSCILSGNSLNFCVASNTLSVANTFQITLGIPLLAELMQETKVTTSFSTVNNAVLVPVPDSCSLNTLPIPKLLH
jgi:hypothetical protein